MPSSSETGINAPESPPTNELANIPPFFTASLRSASAAVVPWVPHFSRPISSKILATLSPIAGVGARLKSTIPNGTLSLFAASFATRKPVLVILNAVFLIVSETVSKSAPLTFFKAAWTTPGPETPTFITHSGSPIPWKAPAIKGLSSTAFENTTSFAQPIPSSSFVRFASSVIVSPIRFTAFILSPVFVEATFTDEQIFLVAVRASGIERMRISSPFVQPLWTSAEKPPKKFTPTSSAAFCRASAKQV